MAIAIDANSISGVQATVSTYNWSHTVGSLSNGILIVCVQGRDVTLADLVVSSITFGAANLTKYTSRRNPTTFLSTEIWYLVNPTASTASITVTTAGTVSFATAFGSSFSGVDQTRPLVQHTGNNADTTTTISSTLDTLCSNSYLIDTFYNNAGTAVTVDASQTQIANQSPNAGGDRSGGSYKSVASPTSSTMSWTYTSAVQSSVHLVAEIRASGEVSPTWDIDAISRGRNSTGDLTIAHVVSSTFGSNRALVVTTTVQDGNHTNYPVVSVKWNTTESFTKVRSDEPAGNVRTEIWYLLNPTAGSFNVVIDITGTVGESTATVIGLVGIAQSSALDANNGVSGTSAAPSVSLTTVGVKCFAVSVCCAEDLIISPENQAKTGEPQTDQSFENSLSGFRNVITAGATTLAYDVASSQAYAESTASFLPFTGISFDVASNSGYQAAASTYNWLHVCSGSNRYLIVGVSLLSVAGSTVTGITYNTVAMTFLGAISSGAGAVRSELWGLIAPATGSNSIAVTLSASIVSASCAISFTGVHQTSPTEGLNSATATNVGAADATVNVTTVATNDWVVDQVATDDTAITVGALQTSRNNVTGAVGSGADSTEPATTAGAYTMSWTNVAALATWSIAAIAIRDVNASSLNVSYHPTLLMMGV